MQEEQESLESGDIQGGGCDCSVGTGGPWWLGIVLYAVVRRLVVVLVGLGLVCDASAQVDAQRTLGDGGDWLLMREPDFGLPWTGALSMSLNHAQGVAKLVDGKSEIPLLEQVTTREVSTSMALGEWIRMGLGVPLHGNVWFAGEQQDQRLGDVLLWFTIPLTDSTKEKGLRGTWTVGLDLPTGAPELFLGDPGAAEGTLALGVPLGLLELAGNIGLRAHPVVELPGVAWGNAIPWGVGLRAEPMGPLFVAAEVGGRAPLAIFTSSPAQFAGESVGVLGVVVNQVALSVAAGRGFSRGIGSPRLRYVAALDFRPRTLSDRDEDGITDARDLCPLEPEDDDGYRDRDGCPDRDNDLDGIVDEQDACPMLAENFDGVEDDDGCPEHTTLLTVRVSTEEEAETIRLTLGDQVMQLLPGEVVEQKLRAESISVLASADRHRSVVQKVALGQSETAELDVVLEALPFGWLRVAPVGVDGEPMDAVVAVDGAEVVGEVELEAGVVAVSVETAGFLPVSMDVEVLKGEHTELAVVLRPNGVTVDEDRLELGLTPTFEVDKAEIAEGDQALQELLDWLRAHPEAELVRVEGHADGIGTSRHNYELSVRRAEAVVAWLVERGVAPERLTAVGTGEAVARGLERLEDRRVGFVVLIWSGK